MSFSKTIIRSHIIPLRLKTRAGFPFVNHFLKITIDLTMRKVAVIDGKNSFMNMNEVPNSDIYSCVHERFEQKKNTFLLDSLANDHK